MSDNQIERERRLGRIAGILGIIGVIATLAPAFAGLGSDFSSLARDAWVERFEAFDAQSGEILVSQLIQALGILLFAAPLLFLFQAAMNRSESVRRSLVGLTVVGPLFLAISLIAFYFAYDSATPIFFEGRDAAEDVEQFAEDTLIDQGAYSVFTGLQLAGALGMIVALVYTSLQAMRAGLLTRFVGTLGMALGVGFLLLGPIALAIWILTVSPLIAGWWIGPRPPAWDAGEAIPWPKPGEQPPPQEEELASPDDFEGSGRELGDPPPEEEATDREIGESSVDGEDEGPRRRKRKQRS